MLDESRPTKQNTDEFIENLRRLELCRQIISQIFEGMCQYKIAEMEVLARMLPCSMLWLLAFSGTLLEMGTKSWLFCCIKYEYFEN